MKSTDIFPSKSLKAEDLGTVEPVVTIAKVTTQSFDDGSRKPVIHFDGKDKTLVCNKTNWNAIVEITGQEDSEFWTGHRIKLVVARVDFQGKRVPAIRVEPAPSRTVAAQRAAAPPPPSPSVREPGYELNDDDIPF